ncbi:DUF1700 domain-containing protein [Mycoplasmatota bacterium WC44]
MNKNQFLNSLKRHLSPLNRDERSEIIAFYEDRFNNAIYEGKSEQDIINELETPEEIAKNVLNEYGIEQQSKYKKSGVDPAAIIGLLFFDLFMSSWLIPVLLIVPAALGVSWFTYFITFDVFFKYSILKAIGAFLISTGIFTVYLVFIIYLVAISMKVVLWIFGWHVTVFTGNRYQNFVDKLNRYSLFDQLRKIKVTHKLLMIAVTFGIVISLSLSVIWRSASASEINNTIPEETIEVEVFNVLNSDNFELDSIFVNMDVELKPTSDNKITITHYNRQDTEITYKETDNGLEIFDKTKRNTWHISTPISDLIPFLEGKSIFESSSDIVIEIPNNVEFSRLIIDNENGDVEINDIISNTISIHSTNGAVTVDNFNTDNIKTSTVNGRIHLTNGFARISSASTVNGAIEIMKLNDPNNDGDSVEVSAVNGSITLDDVYSKIADLSTVNGSVDYFNSDHSYQLDDLDISTVTGSIDHNINNKK